MPDRKVLHHLLDDAANRWPEHDAIVEPGGGAISYADLQGLSDRLRDRLVHLGVRPGDRVGIYMRKSIDAIVSIFGIMRSGAAYIPVDPDAPAERCAFILNNCSVSAIIAERRLEAGLRTELERL